MDRKRWTEMASDGEAMVASERAIENNMLILLQSRQASYLDSLQSNEMYLYQDGTI